MNNTPEEEKYSELFRFRVHTFPWKHEYVTLPVDGSDRKNKFYRGRHGLLEDIDKVAHKLDDEMWFSITPHEIAKLHAKHFLDCPDVTLVLDAFCGIGGDSREMHKRLFVVGCDLVHSRLLIARDICDRPTNAKCDFVQCDSVRGVRSCFRKSAFDAAYLSPPWGHEGVRNRTREPVFGRRLLSSLSVDAWKATVRAMTVSRNNNVAIFLPRGISVDEICALGELADKNFVVEAHRSYNPDDETIRERDKFKVRAITVYLGDLYNSIV
jgi:hypothetical protein